MKTFFSLSNMRNITVFLIFFFFSILLLIFGNNKFVLSLKSIEGSVLYPFRVVVRSFSSFFQLSFNSLYDQVTFVEKLSQEKSKNLFYQQKLLELNQLKVENARLSKLLSIKKYVPENSILAEVIAIDPGYKYQSLSINRGSVNGITVNSPVVTIKNGETVLVGLVKEISLFTSKIITFKNKDFHVGVLLTHSGVNAVVGGGVDDSLRSMDLLYVDRNVNLFVGEEIVTSPLSNLFPAYIKVGEVSEIETTDRVRMSYNAYISSYIELNKLENVFVLKKVFQE